MKRKRKQPTQTYAPLDSFAVGVIAALAAEGYSYREIADHEALTKEDGSQVSFGAVGDTVRHMQADPSWRGERAEVEGRPRCTTEQEDKEMVRVVKAQRGKEIITSGKVRRRVVKHVSDRTVRRRLREAGLRWLRRRAKRLVPASAIAPRLQWKTRVKQSSAAFLKRWVYTDGMSVFLDRSEAEAEDSHRASLGPLVWRCTEQKDALYKDCVGPSCYKKAQGERIRIWGLLVNRRLFIHIVPEGQKMDRYYYEKIVRNHFAKWLKGFRNPLLVQDNEKCLWCDEPQEALKELGIEVLAWHPPHSPDLNAIENAWSYLRDRLAVTQPEGREDRKAFVKRLHCAVAWVNKKHGKTFNRLCRNQKQRAQDLEDNEGHRTQW